MRNISKTDLNLLLVERKLKKELQVEDKDINFNLKLSFLGKLKTESQILKRMEDLDIITYNIKKSISPIITYFKNPNNPFLADSRPPVLSYHESLSYIRYNILDKSIRRIGIAKSNKFKAILELNKRNIEFLEYCIYTILIQKPKIKFYRVNKYTLIANELCKNYDSDEINEVINKLLSLKKFSNYIYIKYIKALFCFNYKVGNSVFNIDNNIFKLKNGDNFVYEMKFGMLNLFDAEKNLTVNVMFSKYIETISFNDDKNKINKLILIYYLLLNENSLYTLNYIMINFPDDKIRNEIEETIDLFTKILFYKNMLNNKPFQFIDNKFKPFMIIKVIEGSALSRLITSYKNIESNASTKEELQYLLNINL